MSSPARVRPRPPPPPLRLSKTSYRPTSVQADNQLLYDLPSASSVTSPPLDREYINSEVLNSPTTPYTPSQPRSGLRGHPANRAVRALSPPSRSPVGRLSPSPGNDDELERFAISCRAWYFDQDEEHGRIMTQTLTGLPPLLRANYARIQAQIRSSYHTYLAARRKAEFQAHISATVPNGSLPANLRSNLQSPLARQERLERFDRFVKNWCTPAMPGTKPFFESLWAVMRLQVIPENLGGAGSRLIEWEFDDAVFIESAGKEFMLEAIDILKGVLGFEERTTIRLSSSRFSDDTITQQHSRSHSEPSTSLLTPTTSQKSTRAGKKSHSNRSRAPSDPFLDTSPAPSVSPHSFGSSVETNGISGVSGGVCAPPTGAQIEELLARTAGSSRMYTPSLASEAFDGRSQLRIWSTPPLSNPEFISLLSLYPSFLTRRALPRFPSISKAKSKHAILDPEVSVSQNSELREEVRVGTGVLWVGTRERSGPWKGSWWERLKAWLRRLIG